MLKGLRTVVYRVSDLDAAKAWYSRMLNRDAYFDEPYYVGFNVGGYELGLLPEDLEQPVESVTPYWGVDDVHAAWDRLIELGATPHEDIQDVGGDVLLATVHDPFGNVLGIIQNPHFELPDAD